MASVIDGSNTYSCFVQSATASNVVVTMTNETDYKAVISGGNRAGQVKTDENAYNIQLPAVRTPNPLTVSFSRVNAQGNPIKST